MSWNEEVITGSYCKKTFITCECYLKHKTVSYALAQEAQNAAMALEHLRLHFLRALDTGKAKLRN